MQCENTTSVPGPHPGCAEFAGPEEIPCGNAATVTVVFNDPQPYPGDPDAIFVHVCADCERQLSEGEHADPDYLTTYGGIVTADEDRAALDASHPAPVIELPAGLTEIETSHVARVESVGFAYEVLWTPEAPNFLVRSTGMVTEPTIEHTDATLTGALTWVGQRVEAEIARRAGVMSRATLTHCAAGHHTVCNGYSGELGHCACLCHENPAHLASTCPALTAANETIEQERLDAARSQRAKIAWLALLMDES